MAQRITACLSVISPKAVFRPIPSQPEAELKVGTQPSNAVFQEPALLPLLMQSCLSAIPVDR